MVSSDFGKLDVRRHLISGADCAMAGEATVAAAARSAACTCDFQKLATIHICHNGISSRAIPNPIPLRSEAVGAPAKLAA